eukprot:TRINITY_DN22685_c0_g2_i2.p1 TRINITY_DN22685_c0_g2~~TRINITY_DN22685_c0_g2_i2.p1  ORF type:complete len:553 (-),score=78.42 TRINITY_DN22685_c0_g2_i2:347-2005(-)
MEIYHQYVKLRKEFGRHPRFVDEGAEMLADIRPNEQHAAEYISRNPVTTNCQVVPEMSEHEANTNAVIYANKAMTHVEGGWPKEVDYTEAEHVIRYCKKVEKDEEYVKTVVGLSQKVEQLAKQNNAIDIYEEYFDDITTSHAAEVPYANTLTVFRDPQQIKRNASYLSWSPDGGKKLAIAYSILEFQGQPSGMSLSSYIWDVNNPNTPDFELCPLSQLCCLKFNNKDPNIVGAGQYNGQFSFFDVRKGNKVCEASPMERCHRDPVFDFSWLQSKTGTECMSVSTDGYVYWWDIRKLGEPLEDLPLKEKNSELLLGGVALEYDPAAGATKFMIGTEQGTILSCNRKAKNPQDRVGAAYQGHHGPVYALKRNPFYPKYFVSIGDWAARLWTEDLKTPLIQTKYHPTYLMGGTWSPSRPGVFFTIKRDGCMDVWDMFYTHNDPTLKVQVTDQPLVSFGVVDTGQQCAVGAVDGSCALLELCDGLVTMAPNEKQAINNMFERETSREKNLEKIQKEAKIKAKKDAAKKEEILDTVTDEEIQELEENFFKAINAARQ